MTHTHTCETAEEKECTCECQGRFHGIAKQMSLEEFETIEMEAMEIITT